MLPTKGRRHEEKQARPKRAPANVGPPEAGTPCVPRPHVPKFGKLLYHSSP